MRIREIIFLCLLLVTINAGMAQNSGLHFDGVNDRVNLGGDAGDGVRSIELWFRLTNEVLPTNSNRITLVTRNSDNQMGEFGIYIGYAFLGERGRVTFTRQVGSSFYYIYSDQNSWQANKWYHVAAVIDPQDGMKMYIDGILQQDTDPSCQATASENEITTIGCWGDKYIRWFAGDIDELRFWNRALSSSEIIDNMCDSINPQNAEGLSGYWKMNEGSGDTIYDHGFSGQNGFVNGAVYIEENSDFSYDINEFEVQFYATGISNSYTWDFGDGCFSSEKNPVHVYDSSGTYTVCLSVDGKCDPLVNCKDITICLQPVSNFSANINDFEVDFNQLSQGALTYYWDFGDGNISTEINPTHTYDSTGTYIVCLTVTNNCGSDILCHDVVLCIDPSADFNYGVNELTVGFYQLSTMEDDYQWDFGDGTHSTEAEPVHTYNDEGIYNVSLLVSNDCGADQHFDTIYLFPPMMCNFSFEVDEDGIIHFLDESLDAMSCYWEFGDGSTSTDQHPVHKYEANGTYNCCLTIENTQGDFTFCDEVVVESIPEEQTELKIYVDPAGESLKINIPYDDYYEIIIFDTWGKPAYSNELFLPANAVYEIGLSGMSGGVYIVSVKSDHLYERMKVMVPQF